MSAVHIDAAAYAGTDIADACAKLCEVAGRINCNLHCNFNDVTLIVRPGDDPLALADAWRRELKSGYPHKVAAT